MLFTLLKGRHIRKENGKDVTYRKGDTVESDRNLAKLFRGKFQEQPDVQPESTRVGKGASETAKAAEAPAATVEPAGPTGTRGRDVTDQFFLAKKNGLTVFRKQAMYTVFDGVHEVYSGKTKKAFLAWLKRYTEV